MKIVVEDEILELELPRENVRLGQVIEEVEDFLFTVGKVPQALSIDSTVLSQEDLQARVEQVLSGTETLEFGVISVPKFILGNVEGAMGANEEFVKNIEIFAEEIHSAEKSVSPDAVIQEMTQFFDFWIRIQNLVPIAFTDFSAGGKTIQQTLDAFRALLGEIVSAMEDKDFVLAADLLQYEVAPLVKGIGEGLPQLRSNLEAMERGDGYSK
jgi:hypothetical protein